MPLDPQARQALDQIAALGLPPVPMVPPAQARLNFRARPRVPGPSVVRVTDMRAPGPDGEVPVRVYTPEGKGPFPVLVWFHGGGWVVGDLETADPTARHLAVGAGCIVVSVDYRLAPETRFPGAAEDCYAATVWAEKNAERTGGDPKRVAVGGDSAGGNLATVVALMARERKGPSLRSQLLVYPVTDGECATPSYSENAEGYGLTRETMRAYWEYYLRSPADTRNPHASPAYAKDLGGLPPALVITAEYDPLRDEGEAYAARLKAAGVRVSATRYPGMVHGFFGMVGAVDKAQQAVTEASTTLRAAFKG